MSLEDRLRRIAGWAGVLGAGIGLACFALWVVGPQVASVSAQLMPPPVALGIGLAGLSLWFQHRGENLRWALITAGIAGSLALLVLMAAYSIPAAFQPETSATHRVWTWGSAHAGILLLASAIALLTLPQEKERHIWPWSAWLANLIFALGAAALLPYFAVHGKEYTPPIDIPAMLAVALQVIAIGIMLARPEDKHVRILFARNAAGVLSRRLFFAVGVLPVAFGGAFMWLVGRNWIGVNHAVLLLVAATILSGFIVALFSVETAAGMSEGREEAEQARLLLTARLQEHAVELQEIVSQRTRELREANASLRAAAESNALLALVAQNTTNGVVITDADGRIEWVNGAFTRLTGYQLAEVKGRKPGHVLQGPETDPATVAQIRRAERAGEPCHVEILNYTKEGRPFWQMLDIQPVRERSGRLVNSVANQTDITAQRADKVRLEHLAQRLELATRAAELGVWEWDAVAKRTSWDARAFEIYGVDPDEFTGTPDEWLKRLHPDDRDRADAAVQSVLHGVNGFQQEFRIIRGTDGAVRHISSSAIAQRDEHGRLLRIIGTDRDVTAAREATHQLKNLNERLQLALRSSKYGVWEVDLASNRADWDERMQEIYGLQAGEFDGTDSTWLNGFHPDDRNAVTAQVRRIIEGQVHDYDLKFRIVRRDGTIRHLEAHGHVQRDASGHALRLVGLARDVTESKQLEQALELAEQRWQLAIEGSNDSVWDWDVATGHVYHDERWSRILGYEPGELDFSIDGWKALAHPQDLADNEAAIQEHFAQHTSFYCHELRMRAKDGSWRWILDRGKVVQRGPEGQPLRMVGTHSDVTARRELEERLRKTEELAQEVSRIALIGGWEIDLVDSRMIWNEGTRRIHEVADGFQPALAAMSDFLSEDALATFQGALREVTPSQPSFDLEVPLTTARGRRIWVRLLGHGDFVDGRAISVRGAIQDITARHESEHARRELEAQLFQAQKMETLGTLAGGIAHDFNNLLTGIIGYHELAADSLPEGHPSRECLAEARNASLRARELVEQILTFGRQSASTEHVPVDLITVVEEARRFLRATVPANITIEVECAPHCGQVLADATQLHQVILNLGSNAAHAMRQQGGTLRISLEPAEVTADLALTLGGPAASSYVRLSVSDTGHGMDESTRRRIFDPFFTTKNTREGTGLGLAVVHGIVRSHRGAIDVESTPGRGSAFHVYLPTVAVENLVEAAADDSAPRGGGEYVCVVDDEEVVGSCTKLVLESQGYRSLIFSSAEQCLAQVQANPSICAVLVTDQTMPGMQGTELAAAIRRLKPDLPVVIMSGYFSKISPQALDELGQIELLAKPFTTDELAHAVHRALHPAERVI
ncbi:MAG TPA: PAS domain-containing protein [Opitutaceae bacterium]|nr:PAS domain-containing protein [Opitutaceae bacterium]